MKGKGSGWHGESRRHSMARRGISTADGRIMKAYGVQQDANGEYLVSEGILGDIYEKAKSSITQSKVATKLKEVGAKAKEVVVGTPEVQAKKKELKEQKELTKIQKLELKKVKETEKAIAVAEERDLKQAQMYGLEPEASELDVSNKGRVGAIQKKISAKERGVSPEKLTDLPDDVFTSRDADSQIAVAENTEQLIDYSSELKYDIGMLDAEKKRLSKVFGADRRAELKKYQADKDYERSNVKEQVENLKMSNISDTKLKAEEKKLVAEHKKKFEQRRAEIDAMSSRNKVTLNFLDDLADDLGRIANKFDKRIRRMTASGQKRCNAKEDADRRRNDFENQEYSERERELTRYVPPAYTHTKPSGRKKGGR